MRRRLLPMELEIGDRLPDETGEWEVISRPFASAAGKLASVHMRKVGRPDVTNLRTWSAHERIAVDTRKAGTSSSSIAGRVRITTVSLVSAK